MNNFKPMLAGEVDLKSIAYPVLASTKLDGVRATFINGTLKTRSLKDIPNRYVNDHFRSHDALDGELIVGDPFSPTVFRDTMKVVSAHEATIENLKFYVFDYVSQRSFHQRLNDAREACNGKSRFVHVPHVMVWDEDELLQLEEEVLDKGYEGLMLRDPEGGYKFGRSTTREGLLLKMKRRLQSEARVIGFVEQMHNANEAKIDNLGYTERSSHQANMIPMNTLGALTVVDVKTGVEFSIGTGFTMEDRNYIWKMREWMNNKLVTYEYLPVGVKDKPRHPVFIGFRMEEDK